VELGTHNPLVVGSNPTGPNSQHPENKPLTKTDKAGTKPEKQNLVSGLFSALENAIVFEADCDHWGHRQKPVHRMPYGKNRRQKTDI